MTSRPRAFVVHQPMRYDKPSESWVPNVDLSGAGEYGDLIFVLNTPERPPLDPEASLPTLRDKLKDFQKHDYLVLAGDMNLVAYAVVLATKATGGYVNLLRWHPRDHRYIALPSQVYTEQTQVAA